MSAPLKFESRQGRKNDSAVPVRDLMTDGRFPQVLKHWAMFGDVELHLRYRASEP